MSDLEPTLHPWNVDFTWMDRIGSFRTLDDDQVRRFDRDGYVVVPEVFDRDVLAELVEEIDRFEAETDTFLASQADGRILISETGAITFTVHLVERSAIAAAASRHPTLVGICADLVGPDVRLYWDQAVYKKPAKPRRFPWHQDNGYTFVEPQQYLTCWVALAGATVHNGCPVVAPGLHRRGTLAHHFVDPLGFECLTDPPGAVAAEVAAGGVVVFSSLTPHLTGPNISDAVRKAYILQYGPSDAVACHGDPAAGPPLHRDPCDDPARQFEVLRGGRPVETSSM